ncbi:Transcriptional regulator SlyA [bioreactor metagenome]|uniref:Transcriptional regulator SlyA n=1 Tax=bioreactor metagenome TaxID=1076179 RepID=A0A645G1P7_9ZZZZ
MLEIFDSLCILLAKAEQKHFLYTKKALEEAQLEISPGQLVALYAPYKKDNISISELSKNVFLDNSTLTGLIDRLERVNFVKRVDVPHDRRSYQICLTDKAREVESKIMQVMRQVENKMLENCSESEVITLRSVLKRIFTNF